MKITATPAGKINVHLKQDIVLPCGQMSTLSTAVLNVDCPKPQPYQTGVRPKWIHSVRLHYSSTRDPFKGTIDMLQYPATPKFVMDHLHEMTPVAFPEVVQIKSKRPNMVKLEKIRKRIQQKCFAQAFHHTWNRHKYMVLAFTDTNSVEMDVEENEYEESGESEVEPGEATIVNDTKEETPNKDQQEVRKNLWISVSRGNVFKVSNIKKLIPKSLLPEWHQYELKAIRAMVPEFVGVHFQTLIQS
jgi:hypothetical protein